MRSRVSFLLVIALCTFWFSPAPADLPSRYELLEEKYDNDRAEGIRRLNEKYILALDKELDIATSARDLDEANGIADKIRILKEEIASLTKDMSNKGNSGEALLVGKTASFQQDRFPDFTATAVFLANGKAIFTGVSMRPANYLYEESEESGLFHFWDERKNKDSGFKIRVHANGKSGIVETLSTGNSVRAELNETE